MVTLIQPKLPRVKFHPVKPGTPYRPCNGSEGEYFMSMWCEDCARDKEMNGTVFREGREAGDDDWCEILGRSFRSDEPLPEWVYGPDSQPCCTQFVPMDQPIPEPRCEKTADMFQAECEHRWKVTQQGMTYHDCRCELCGATKRESWD
jgi:hypothetical protein